MPNSRGSSSSSGDRSSSNGLSADYSVLRSQMRPQSFSNGRSAASSSSWNPLSAASSALRAQMWFQQRSQTTAYVPSRVPTNTASMTNVQPPPVTSIGWHGQTVNPSMGPSPISPAQGSNTPVNYKAPLPNTYPWSPSFVYTNPHAPFNPMFPNSHDQTLPEVSPPPTSPTRAGQGQDWSSRQMQLWSQFQMRPPQNSQTLAYTTQSIDDIPINIDLQAVYIPPTPRAEQKTNWASRGLSISHELVSEVPPSPTSSAQTTGRWGDWTSRGWSISQQLVSQVPTSRTSSTQTAGQYTDWASGTKQWSKDKGKGKKA